MTSPAAGSFFNNRKAYLLALILLLLAGFLARMIDLTNPPMDFHPTRQYRAAIIARSIYLRMDPGALPDQGGFATEQRLLDYVGNLEPPITETVVALVYLLIGQELLWVSRIVTSLFWIAGGLALYLLVSRLTNRDGALVSLGFYLFTPFAIIASRSFQPDVLMTASMLWALLCFHHWLEHKTWKWVVLTGLASGFTLLVKPNPVFILLTVYAAMILLDTGIKQALKSPQVWTILAITAILPAPYYLLINPGAGGFYDHGLRTLISLARSPHFYLGWAGIINSVVGAGMMIIGLAGALLFEGRKRILVLGMWAGYLLLGFFVAYHTHTHDYYSLIFIPVVAISLGTLGAAAADRARALTPLWKAALVFVAILAAAYPTWTAAKTLTERDFRGNPGGWRQVGEAIPPDKEVIALTHMYGHYLAYYGFRQVHLWPYVSDLDFFALQGRGEITDFDEYFDRATRGFDLFLVTLFGELESQPLLKEKLSEFPVFSEGPAFTLYDLRQ